MVFNEEVPPIWEVVLRVDGHIVAVAAAFVANEQSVDVGVGVMATSHVGQYAALIRQGAFAIEAAKHWEEGTEVPSEGTVSDEANPPF